jgi:MoaA/NifB/PqqE/SkfB family radical SAM enzyme
MGLFKKLISVSPRYIFKELNRRYRLKFRPEWRNQGYAGALYAVSFWLTNRCNLQCSMCFVNKPGSEDRKELGIDELKKVLDDLRRWHPRIGITGGEPLLRKDIVDFISHAKKLDLKVGLNSNAVLIDEDYANALVASGLDNLTVSVDGPPSIHDTIRGKSGLFERAIQGIKHVHEARNKAGKIRPLLRITCTITQENQDSFAELGAKASDPKLGLEDMGIQHLWFIPPGLRVEQREVFMQKLGQDSPNLDGFVVENHGIDPSIVIKSLELLKQLATIPVVENPALDAEGIKRYYMEEAPVLAKPCYSRFLRMEINPYGDVTPCLSWVAGNVREQSVSDIWNNERYRQFRQTLTEESFFPGCLRCCGLFSD